MTQTRQHNVPALRFSEFNREWLQECLGDYFTFKNGVNADKSAYGKGYKFINVLDIIADRPIKSENIIGSVSISDKEFEKNKIVYGDILFQRSSETREEVGQSNVYLDQENSATFGGFVIRGHPKKEIIPEFFHSLLKTTKVRKDMTSRSGGSTRYNVGQDSLSQVSIKVAPTLPEQQKIASFLSSVDRKIAQLGEKKALLQAYKKGMMQKLFSQELRFKDPQGHDFPEWEEKRLGEVVEIVKGQQLNRDDMIEDGVFPVINGGISASGFTDKPNTKGGIVTISEGGNSCGYVSWQETEFWLGGHCYALELNTTMLGGLFLFHALKSNQSKIMRLRVGSGLPNIQKRDLIKLEFFLPNLAEQRKIANFLSSIDRKINLVATELDYTKSFKHGLLQQMFI